jgi:large subunit ribosomal protein L25
LATMRLMAHRCEAQDHSTARRLRREGKLPAVLYGHDREETIAVEANKLQGILQSEAGENTLIALFINGDPPERCHVMLRAVLTDPVSLAPLHSDFDRVSIDEAAAMTRRKLRKQYAQEGLLESKRTPLGISLGDA